MLFLEFTFYASITLSTFESEQLFVMVINAIIASSEMKILVSHLFLSSILTSVFEVIAFQNHVEITYYRYNPISKVGNDVL